MPGAHIHRAIRKRAEQLDDVVAKSVRTSSGQRRTWYYHEPCDDGTRIHGSSPGFMPCVMGDDGAVLRCKTCGYEVDRP